MVDFISNIASDNFRFARSKTLIDLADGVYNLINLPKHTFVIDGWLRVVVPYSGGAAGSATVGFTGNGEVADPDGFLDVTAAAARAAGYKRFTSDAQPGSVGKWFNDAGGQVTITLSDGTDTTLMTGYVFIMYSVLH